MRTPPPAIALAACIRGELPERVDWDALLCLANRSWMTPQVFVSLDAAGMLAAVPDEVRDYLGFVHARNLERNRRLRRQLREAVRALNAAGIAPTVLKGAVDLACERGRRLGARIVTDLDLLLPEGGGELAAAHAVMRQLGYSEFNPHHPAALYRSEDAGALELHGWPAAGEDHYRSLAGIEAGATEVVLGTARVHVPAAHLRILQLVIHDHIKEGDDWRGSVDLRHLHDISRMLRGPVDWHALRAAPHRWRERDALEDALMMAERLFGVAVPPPRTRTVIQRLRHHRRLAPLLHPILGAPLRRAGDLAWACRRTAGGGMSWPRLHTMPHALARAVRDPSRATRFLIGSHIGPKA